MDNANNNALLSPAEEISPTACFAQMLAATDGVELHYWAEQLHLKLATGQVPPVVDHAMFAPEGPYCLPRTIYIRRRSGKRWSYTIGLYHVAHLAMTRLQMHVWDERRNGAMHCTFTFSQAGE